MYGSSYDIGRNNNNINNNNNNNNNNNAVTTNSVLKYMISTIKVVKCETI